MDFMSIARRLRMRLHHGLRVAYFRDVIRPRILRTAPVVGLRDETCEIHVLTSARDWLNLLWTLKSFYWMSGRRYGLCIHDDGSLIGDHKRILQSHFPDSTIVMRSEADRRMKEVLRRHARCHTARFSNHLTPKLFDFVAYLRCDRMMILDSDVLFFRPPVELIRRIEDRRYLLDTVNRDVESAYTVDREEVDRLTGVRLQERFNSGLGLIHRDSIQLDWIEEFLMLPGIYGHRWLIEQTLFALCSSRHGVELLPAEYDVHLGKGLNGASCRHYVGAVRHLMYAEGVCRLVRSGFLEALEGGFGRR